MTSPGLPELPVTRLVVWRHGRTAWNAAGRFQGQLDPPLDEVGRAQAVHAAPHLVASAALAGRSTAVVASDLVRAAETARALTGVLDLPLQLDPRLREHGMGSWEGLTRAEVADRHPEQYADWMAGRPVRGRGGEEPATVGERVLAALLDLPPVEVAVVVTHGGTSGRLLELLLEFGPDHRRVFGPLGNCAWSELARQSGRWRLMRHNSSAGPLPEGLAVPPAERLHADPAPGARSGDGDQPAQDADAVG
ncbi:histidine phosphatase family protein [Blastococcus xanthinilyticus]|uniref:Putative phosphoglycerate mutase n=1 Tax=Blastococcus xanthinilyticus TaxID=1564164 RepID=A0A5S5CXH3_9ACTN|nr:histidine phosphatase family protein [Blastococcus xanthinilyticus]TYP87536.1 putative phosphoglycerate mutase [Blastococcus xanthinilyticus]